VKQKSLADSKNNNKTTEAQDKKEAKAVNNDLALLNSIPELAALGPVFKTCAAVDLTEKETEYVVSCIKHILAQHVVFQFSVTNNMEDQQLENVSVEMECEQAGWSEEMTVPEEKLVYQIPGTTFACFNRPKNSFSSGAITCTLKFTVKDVVGGEVAAKGSDEEYQLEEIEVSESDFMRPGENIGLIEFKRQWEQLTETKEVSKKYSLGLDTLQAAVDAVVDLLGMTPCEGTGVVQDAAKGNHGCMLVGSFFGGIPVLARAGFVLDSKPSVTLRIAVRSPNPAINTMLTNAIR
jgi:coatomer protein complex subunit gamma